MKKPLYILLGITLANYIAQIPYDLYLYHGLTGNPRAALLLAATFALFAVSFALLARRSRVGYAGMIIFLSLEFLFYFSNFIFSMMIGHAPFFQLANPNPILFAAFLIGYINLFASGYFLFDLVRHRKRFAD